MFTPICTSSLCIPSPDFAVLYWTVPPQLASELVMESEVNPGETDVGGVGVLTYQGAIDIARNSEGQLDSAIHDYLEQAITDIWARILAQPDTYVMTYDEFAVFNFYIQRFDGHEVAELAVERYWRYTHRNGAQGTA